MSIPEKWVYTRSTPLSLPEECLIREAVAREGGRCEITQTPQGKAKVIVHLPPNGQQSIKGLMDELGMELSLLQRLKNAVEPPQAKPKHRKKERDHGHER